MSPLPYSYFCLEYQMREPFALPLPCLGHLMQEPP